MVLCCVQPGGQLVVSGQNQAPIQKKNAIQRTTLVHLVSSVFSAKNDPVGNVALPVSYQSFSSLDVDESGHHEN